MEDQQTTEKVISERDALKIKNWQDYSNYETQFDYGTEYFIYGGRNKELDTLGRPSYIGIGRFIGFGDYQITEISSIRIPIFIIEHKYGTWEIRNGFVDVRAYKKQLFIEKP